MSKEHDTCGHCYHPFSGPVLQVLQPGCIVEQCCKCLNKRTVHAAHAQNASRLAT